MHQNSGKGGEGKGANKTLTHVCIAKLSISETGLPMQEKGVTIVAYAEEKPSNLKPDYFSMHVMFLGIKF